MSITNFRMTMADVEALGAFADPARKMTDAQLDRLIAKSREARDWLISFYNHNDQAVRQPKEPA